MSASATSLEPGSLFAGDFEVQRALATSDAGAVYSVRQRSTGRLRALRTMAPDALEDESLRQRFARDAMAASQVESDHVVKVYAAGVDAATRTPWVCMELLTGADLATTVRSRGALPLSEVAEIARQLGHALAAAHREGIAHRNLKPEKVFLAESRSVGAPFTVKVLDFGIAELLSKTLTSATAADALGATLWMAPEQTEAAAPVGPPADVFALALLVFWMLTGRTFWRAGDTPGAAHVALLREMLQGRVPTASERAAERGAVPPWPQGFDAWFSRCVARDPAARFAEAGSAVSSLLALLDPPSATPAPQPRAPKPPPTVAMAQQPPPTFVPSTEVIPRAVVEQAVAKQTVTPRVLGAAPPPTAHAPAPSPPTRRRWPWVVIALIAVGFGGAELALTLSSSDAPPAQTATLDGGVIVPIPLNVPRIDAAIAPWPTLTAQAVDVPAVAPRGGRRSRDDAGAESPWYYDVPTAPQADVPRAPPAHDAGHPTAHDAGHPTAHDAGHPTTQPHDAGHPTSQPHDAGHPTSQPATPHDAGQATPHAPSHAPSTPHDV